VDTIEAIEERERERERERETEREREYCKCDWYVVMQGPASLAARLLKGAAQN
jgi:hypothetical protein